MKRIFILPSFENSVKNLTPQEKRQLAKGLEAFNLFLLTGNAPFGFRYKKIGHNKYEFRINIRLRAIVKESDDVLYLVLVGSHEDVTRYLRNFR